MNGNRSVATIDAPEFINLEPFNPLISSCEIKVFYLGQNRNGSYITKDVAIQMANSLPGCPIVGAYREEIEDFGDHGHVMRIEDGEIKFSVKTKPYGFVSPDAAVWFKDFTDIDEFGNETVRTYLMTTGYLWTGQYEEAQSVLAEGKGQSMELDEKNLSGKWAKDNNSGLDFFIINDAVFSKLCILGDGIEPCFEGAAVTAPDVSKEFSKDIEFHQTLFTMMNELKDALESKGGSNMPEEFEEVVDTEQTVTEFTDSESDVTSTDSIDAETETEDTETEVEAEEVEVETGEDSEDEEESVEGEINTLLPTTPPEVEVSPGGPGVIEPDPKPDPEPEPKPEDPDDPEDDDKHPYDPRLDDDDVEEAVRRLINHSVDETLQELENLRAEVESLREFKHQVELEEKKALIAKYYMLNEGDKAPFIENIENYSLNELEAQLALLYVQQNVDFSADEVQEKTDEEPIVTFTLEEDAAGMTVPPMVEALRRTKHE